MFSFINNAIVSIGDFICGYPLFILFIGGGLFLFIYSGTLPIRKLGTALRSLHVQKAGEGQISSFQALMSTISSLDAAISIMDMAFAIMAIPDMIAIFMLAPKVKEKIKDIAR